MSHPDPYLLESLDDPDGPSVWPVVADVFIGFLVLVLIATIASYVDAVQQAEGSYTPPPAKEDFRLRFEEAFAHGAGLDEGASRQSPEVKNEEFSELRIYFPASFLFRSCEYQPMDTVADEINRLRDLLRDFDDSIQRVQITGHTDRDPIGQQEDNRCRSLGVTTNWQLSARRAIAILERLAPEDRAGLNPEKVWAAALGPYDPVIEPEVTDQDKQTNRRIEMVIKFKE